MPKLTAIQGLRALAALSIAVLHGQHEAGLLAARLGIGFAPWRAVPWEAGVDVFFVISGFVMVWASGPLFGAAGAGRSFLARRLARIVPLYWLTTTAFLAVALIAPAVLLSPTPTPGFVLASYAFVPAARANGAVQPLYSLGWTLNYEMMFYALFALAIALPRRQAVASAAAGLVAIVLAGRLLSPLPTALAFWSDPIVLEFGFGMALGLLRAEGVRLSGPIRAALAAGGLLLLVAGPEMAGPLAYGVPAALLVAACGLGIERPGLPGGLARLGETLGDASYAVYLVHPFVIRGVRQAVEATIATLPPAAFLLAALAATLLVAHGVHERIERPLTRRLRRLLDRPSRTASRPA